jgi:hypothetical protein
MGKNSSAIDELHSSKEDIVFSSALHVMNSFDLKLVAKKVKMKYSPYKISTELKNMVQSETIGISSKGVLFTSKHNFEPGTLMRVWIEIPNYWSLKSRYVDYRHTDAPIHFQILTRVLHSQSDVFDEIDFQVLCETLNIDSVDDSVLQDYLANFSEAKKK